MVTITSSLGRYAVLLTMVALGKSNYVIADGSSLMEPSSTARAGTHRQILTCCYNSNGCHPIGECNLNASDCLNSKGKYKCNKDNSYNYGVYGPPPAPTNPSTPAPTNPPDLTNPGKPAPTNPPSPKPVSLKYAGTVKASLWSLIS
jgi:hypothetical protein